MCERCQMVESRMVDRELDEVNYFYQSNGETYLSETINGKGVDWTLFFEDDEGTIGACDVSYCPWCGRPLD